MLFAVCCLLLVVCCVLFGVLMSGVCWLFVECVVSVVCYVLCVVRCVLFGVRCFFV